MNPGYISVYKYGAKLISKGKNFNFLRIHGDQE